MTYHCLPSLALPDGEKRVVSSFKLVDITIHLCCCQ